MIALSFMACGKDCTTCNVVMTGTNSLTGEVTIDAFTRSSEDEGTCEKDNAVYESDVTNDVATSVQTYNALNPYLEVSFDTVITYNIDYTYTVSCD